MESLYLLILAFFIIIIIFPFSFNLEGAYNININDGYFFFKIWRITLKKVKFKRKGKAIILIEKHKNESLEIEINEEQLRFWKLFINEVKDKIKIRKIDVQSETGLGDPYKSSLFSGVFSSLILAFFARLKSSQPTASFVLNNQTNFFEFYFEIKAFLRFSISIFDIIFSFVLALLKTKKDKILERKLGKV